ncbi:branched-chain amino acid ABC transporter permease [Brevibacillus fulvus]|uniref:Branched-chain amino acid transport system permease protein n=1 Tax=Brevibacillus fulvus TaxID=1125967 RepID=A0A938XRK6_9BACL|nr:branched-chain amino acid ABC transporter permease [Brevibacillus fulvus]MBM7588968.1 branched-chain amino acid transport system permease protein [Brevibacillus fulvus]
MKASAYGKHIGCIALFLLCPFILTSYGVKLASEVLIMAIFVMSLGLIIGFAGLVSLGHAAFFGLGAYAVALLGNHWENTYLLLISALVISGLAAFLSGLLFIRSSGAYFLMITLAFGQMIYAIVYKLEDLTGGADGMAVVASPNLGAGPIDSRLGFFYLTAVAFLISYYFLRLLIASPFGKSVRGIKENESRMTALGYQTRTYKLAVYTISGMLAGVAGALYAYFNQYVSPDLLYWMFSGQALIMVIVGGVGTLVGPAIGAGFFVVLQNYISSFTDRWPLIMGLIFVLIVLFGKGGIMQIAALLWQRFRPQRNSKPAQQAMAKEGNGIESVKS